MTSFVSRRARAARRAARNFARRRPRVLVAVAVAVVIVFAVILLLYAGSTIGGGSEPGVHAGGGNGGSSPPSGTSPGGTSVSPGPSRTATSGALPTVPGVPGAGSTQLTTLSPGSHRVVVTARSSQPLLAVGYAFAGDKGVRKVFNVKSPVVLVRTITGQGPFATIVIQIGPTATSGTCSISIDGKVLDSRSTDRPYGTTGCSA